MMLPYNTIQHEAIIVGGVQLPLSYPAATLLFQHMGLGHHLEAHLEMVMAESGLDSVPHLDLAHARRCPYSWGERAAA